MGIDNYRGLLDGYMGRKRYRYLQETLGWPRGQQYVLIATGDSWMATWAALDVDTYMRLLDDHMGRI